MRLKKQQQQKHVSLHNMLVIATVRCSPAISSFSRVGRPFIMKSFVEIKVLLVLLQLDRQCTEALTDLLKGSLVTAVRIRGGWRLCLYIRSHVIRGLHCTWFMMMGSDVVMWYLPLYFVSYAHCQMNKISAHTDAPWFSLSY